MRRYFYKRSFIAVPFLLGLFFFTGLTDVHAAKNFGLTTTNQLVSFNTPFPRNVTTIGPITGLQSLRSSDNSIYSVQFGAKPDLPTQNDYDGDGKTDVSVYRPQTGTFFVLNSSGGVTARQFGQNGDYPVANYDTH